MGQAPPFYWPPYDDAVARMRLAGRKLEPWEHALEFPRAESEDSQQRRLRLELDREHPDDITPASPAWDDGPANFDDPW